MKTRFAPWLAIAMILSLGSTAFAQEFLLPGIEYKADDVIEFNGHPASPSTLIVSFDPDMDLATAHALVTNAGFEVVTHSTIDGLSFHPAEIVELDAVYAAELSHSVIRFDGVPLRRALAAARRIPGVTAAYPNYAHTVDWTPNDPLFASNGMNFKQIRVEQAWDLASTTAGKGVVVAVIDTGYRKTGLLDKAMYVQAGYDFYYEDTDPNDFYGHGTHVSNTIAERTNNHTGAAGIAFYATILPLKVFPDGAGYAYENDIIDAINYARTKGAKVINMSLGGGAYVKQTRDAILAAWNAGCMTFAASGNNGASTVSYPAAYDYAIAVGSVAPHAVGAKPMRSTFSNYGTALDIVAPGESVVQETYYNNAIGYYAMSGTSMATPHAVAVAALMIGRKGANPTRVRDVMYQTSYNPNGARTNALGYGEINAFAAVSTY